MKKINVHFSNSLQLIICIVTDLMDLFVIDMLEQSIIQLN